MEPSGASVADALPWATRVPFIVPLPLQPFFYVYSLRLAAAAAAPTRTKLTA